MQIVYMYKTTSCSSRYFALQAIPMKLETFESQYYQLARDFYLVSLPPEKTSKVRNSSLVDQKGVGEKQY